MRVLCHLTSIKVFTFFNGCRCSVWLAWINLGMSEWKFIPGRNAYGSAKIHRSSKIRPSSGLVESPIITLNFQSKCPCPKRVTLTESRARIVLDLVKQKQAILRNINDSDRVDNGKAREGIDRIFCWSGNHKIITIHTFEYKMENQLDLTAHFANNYNHFPPSTIHKSQIE